MNFSSTKPRELLPGFFALGNFCGAPAPSPGFCIGTFGAFRRALGLCVGDFWVRKQSKVCGTGPQKGSFSGWGRAKAGAFWGGRRSLPFFYIGPFGWVFTNARSGALLAPGLFCAGPFRGGAAGFFVESARKMGLYKKGLYKRGLYKMGRKHLSFRQKKVCPK